jgi:hypothetical protein
MSEDEVRARIDAYCARYKVRERNEAGLPVYPAGLRETAQHRDWISLYKLFDRHRKRSGAPPTARAAAGACPICLRKDGPHRRCEDAVALVRELGPESLDRLLRAAAGGSSGPARKRTN